MSYVDVLFPLALKVPLTYEAPEGVFVERGAYVEAFIGNKKLVGVVWATRQELEKDIKGVKKIHRIFSTPPLSKQLRQFIEWLASYALSPLGAVLKLVLVSNDMLTKELKLTPYYTLSRSEGYKVTQARQKVIELLSSQESKTIAQLSEEASVGRPVIKKMIDDGALEEVPAPSSNEETFHMEPICLSEQQQQAFDKLWTFYTPKSYATIVLDGVTGSGKTEVYFKVIEKLLAQGSDSQILILLPEIILTSQLVDRFSRRFGFSPTLWHSSLSATQRAKNWRDIANGKARLVVGARSALFLPYRFLKTIIVDEEHDASYKQEEGVVYHARDAAVMRAYQESIPVILASATPSVETMLNVENNKYQHLTLPIRHGGAVFPELDIIDMRQQQLDASHWISEPLKKALKENFSRGMQSILFLNRRGYAPLMLCRACGYRFQCKECSSWLVTHKHAANLQCHHCGHTEPLPQQCPSCQEEDKLAVCGPGVERIHEEVADLFPEARILVMTSDVMTTAKKATEAIDQILNNEVDIIIGTQLIAKGHHFPKLTLVGVIDADLGLSGGDLRASERTYQLLHQVAGRAGRDKEKGQVMLQSYAPENEVLKALKNEQRNQFIQFELQARKAANMPPYSRLAGVVVSGAQKEQAKGVADMLVRRSHTDGKRIQILGPVEAPIFMLRGKYRYRILLKTTRDYNVQGWIQNWLQGKQVPSSVKIKVDIDPYAFF